jgi:hypothetical protein
MVRALSREQSILKTKYPNPTKMFDQLPGRQVQSFTLENNADDGDDVDQSRSYIVPRVLGERLGDCQYIGSPLNRVRGPVKASCTDGHGCAAPETPTRQEKQFLSGTYITYSSLLSVFIAQ